MKNKLLLGVVILIILCSCSHKKHSLFNPGNIRTQHFTIDPRRDTVLIGLRGSIFRITQGSFDGDGPINIDIREVYNPIEMLYAGLNTESDGRLLESGGMIYFNAKRKGNNASLLKPIAISIPADYLNKTMQLFKGKEMKDGTINWVNPEPLDFKTAPPSIDTGELLLNSYCASCHQLFKDMTGPALAGVEKRVNDRNIIKSFIRDPGKALYENSYFMCEKFKFKSVQPAFPDLTNRNIDLILDYIKNETDKRPDLLSTSPETNPSDSEKKDTTLSYVNCLRGPCGFDTLYVDTSVYAYVNSNMMNLHEEASKEDSMDYLYHNPDSLENVMRKGGFADILQTQGRYNFVIKTMGWFNVDAFYEGMKGTEIVDLFVKTGFPQRDQLEVHVFFPAKKILTVGTLHPEDSLFHFEKYKGQIPLFLNDKAIAFGFGSIGEKSYYGIQSFTVSKQQTIQLEIRECTPEQMANAFKEMNLDGIDLDIITKKRLIVPKKCIGDSDEAVK